MSMYFIGIDISKYKHDCCIISAADQKVVSKVTIKNNKAGFNELLTIIHSLANPADIRIGFESTSHYALNLELFLENSLLTFMEVNPVLISEYKKSKTLRRTKTDSVDCESIARWLMTVEYKPHSKGFYHAYSLKSLTRLRDKLIRQRSFYLIKITNVLDHTFPEFKPFFNEYLTNSESFHKEFDIYFPSQVHLHNFLVLLFPVVLLPVIIRIIISAIIISSTKFLSPVIGEIIRIIIIINIIGIVSPG